MKCNIDECTKDSKCKSLCWMHYKRQQLETNRGAYNEYHRNYQAGIRDKVNEYRKTQSYKDSQKKARKKYEDKIKNEKANL